MPWAASNRNAGFSDGAPWLPVAPEHLPCAVELQEDDPDALLHHYRRAIASRRAHRALALGAQSRMRAEGDLLTFTRAHEGETIFCAFNLGGAPVRVALPEGDWRILEAGRSPARRPIVELGEAFVGLGPWQPLPRAQDLKPGEEPAMANLKLTDLEKTYGGSVTVSRTSTSTSSKAS